MSGPSYRADAAMNAIEIDPSEVLQIKQQLLQPRAEAGDGRSLLERIAAILSHHGTDTRTMGVHGLCVDFVAAPGASFELLRFPITEVTASGEPSTLSPDHPFYFENLSVALMGVVLILKVQRAGARLERNVRVVFQTERPPHVHHAQALIDNGLLSNVCRVLGLHFNPDLPADRIGLRAGTLFPAKYDFCLTIRRRGDRAGSHNLVHAAARVVATLTQITSRKTDPLKPTIISFQSIRNAPIPETGAESVELRGYIEVFEERVFAEVVPLLKATIAGILNAVDMSFGWQNKEERGLIHTDPEAYQSLRQAAQASIGKSRVRDLEYPSKMSADLAEVFTHVPGVVLELAQLPSAMLARVFASGDERVGLSNILVGVRVLARYLLHY